MIRRFNYTGRRSISRGRVHIHIHESGGGAFFDAQIDLSGMGLPAAAEVFVEAYHRSAYQRYAFGTVGRMQRPEDTGLQRFATARPLFRVKVVERSGEVGKILGVADKIVPLPSDEAPSDRAPLLVVEYLALDDGLWKLDLEGDWPTLQLNSRIEGIREAARSGDEFLSLVYPEVARRVWREILITEQHTDPDCNDDDWMTLWLRFACAELGAPRPPEPADHGAAEEWIEQATTRFCDRFEVVQRFEGLLKVEAD